MNSDPTDTGQERSGKLKRRQSRQERKGWIVLIACFGLVAAFMLLAMTTGFKTMLVSGISAKKEAHAERPRSTPTAVIVVETDDDRCEFRRLDNKTGSMVVERIGSCTDKVTLDERGMPVPTGTINRLEAIKKSFGTTR